VGGKCLGGLGIFKKNSDNEFVQNRGESLDTVLFYVIDICILAAYFSFLYTTSGGVSALLYPVSAGVQRGES